MLKKLVVFLVLANFERQNFGQEEPKWYAKSNDACQCGVIFNNSAEFSFGYYNPPYVLVCNGMTNSEHASCFRRMLETTHFEPGLAFEVVLIESNLDLLADDLLTPYNVTTFQFIQCSMSQIPYELLCAKNPFVLLFLRSQIPSSKLTSGGFRNCTRLQKLFFHQSDLAYIPPGSFLGLGSLRSLFMVGNRLEKLPDFEGLTSSLIYLGLHDNPIRSVDRNAFRGLTNLTGLVLVNANITTIEDGTFDSLGRKTQVFLSGNPFYCDCSLQWLQDWLWKHPSNETFMKYLGVKDDDPRCVAPKPGPLKTQTFCNSWSKTPTAPASGWFQELLTAFWQTVDFIGISF